MADKTRRNDGVIVHPGGTINVGGAFAAGDHATATSYGVPAPVSRPPAAVPLVRKSPSAALPPRNAQFDVFVSHATEDKDFVEPLVDILVSRGLNVWYDSSSIRVGNSLRESIDLGLANSRFIIVVLSPSYFARDWTRREVNAIFTRETGGVRLLLPIWHKVTQADVARFSTMLADRAGVRSTEDLETIADKIMDSMEASS